MKEVKSIHELVKNYFDLNKDNIVISQKKDYRTFQITGEELYNNIGKTIALMKSVGVKQGDKIIIVGQNSIEWITVYFASILFGVIVVPLDTMTNKDLFKKIQSEVKAKLIFQDKNLNFSTKIKKVYLDDLLLSIRELKPMTSNGKCDVLEIMYTSGSTGDPKGVVLTHDNIIAGINQANSLVKLRLRLKALNLLPLSHILSQMYGLFVLMHQNSHIYLTDANQPRKIISFVKCKKINGIILVPGILQALKNELEDKNPNREFGIQFRLIGIGGALLDLDLEKWWRKRFYMVSQGYGLTETSSVVSANRIGLSKKGSVGVIPKGIDIKFLEQEILLKGKNITSGYYKNAQKTQESFRNSWFKTGDLGEMKNNNLYIKGRKKDVIVLETGLNIFPEDIEKVINKISGVKDSCVIEKNKKIHVVLILDRKVAPLSIVKKANEKLLRTQRIQSFSVWSERDFPRTSIGKVKKFMVKEKTEKKPSVTFSYKDRLSEIVSQTLHPSKKILSSSKLVDLGMDSLKRIELITKLEKEFGVEIDEVKLDQKIKVNDLKSLLKQKQARRIAFKAWPLNPLIKVARFFGQNILFNPIARIFTKVKWIDIENLKEIDSPVIFASNHQSAWDGAILSKKLKNLAIAADPKYVYGMGRPGLHGAYRKFLGSLTRLFYNTYLFGEKIGTNKSLEFTGELIDREYSILIFPEGQRTRDGKIHEFHRGIGYLALNMNVPIVPIKIDGLFEVLPFRKVVPKFHKTIIKIGKPIYPDQLKDISYLRATKLIEQKVKSL